MDCLEGSRLKRPSTAIQPQPGRGPHIRCPIEQLLPGVADRQKLGGCTPLLQEAKVQARWVDHELAWSGYNAEAHLGTARTDAFGRTQSV